MNYFKWFPPCLLKWMILKLDPRSYINLIKTCKKFSTILTPKEHRQKQFDLIEILHPTNHYMRKRCMNCHMPTMYGWDCYDCRLINIECLHCAYKTKQYLMKYHNKKECANTLRKCANCDRKKKRHQFIVDRKRYKSCSTCRAVNS